MERMVNMYGFYNKCFLDKISSILKCSLDALTRSIFRLGKRIQYILDKPSLSLHINAIAIYESKF